MKKISVILAFFSIFFCSQLIAQDNYAIVTGKVTNSKGKPMPNVKITVSGGNNSVHYTDENGQYEFIIGNTTQPQIMFSCTGYWNYKTVAPKLRFQEYYTLNVILYNGTKPHKY